jgi:hypothetical protein
MTETLNRVEINCETGEQTVRPFTQEEIDQYMIDQANNLALQEQKEMQAQKIAEDKASAIAKLTALGLTEDEARAIAAN